MVPLHLISGRASTGKTGAAYDRLKGTIAAGGSGVLVLPTMPDVIRARQELCSAAPLGLKVLTFHALIEGLWDDFGDGRVLRGDGYRHLALSALTERTTINRSLVSLAARVIELAEEAVGEAWRDAPGAVPSAGRDLADLVGSYARHLQQTDSVETAEAAHHLAALSMNTADVAVFHRFADFSNWQLELVKGLARNSDVFVTLNWDEGFAPSAFLDSLVHGTTWNTHQKVYGAPFHTSEKIAILGDALFSGPGIIGGDDSIRLCLAEGLEAEARGIVAEAMMALNDGHAAEPGAIVVAYRDLRQHEQALRRAFRAAGLPAQIDVSRPLQATPLGSAYVESLRFVHHGERSRLLNVLRSPFSGVAAADARALERTWRRRATTDVPALLRELATCSEDLARVLRDLGARRSGPLVSDRVAPLARLASLLFANARMEPSDTDAQREADASAHRAILELLSQVGDMGEEAPPLLGLLEGLSRTRVSPPSAERPGHVQVLPVSRLRGRRFDVVIIGGLNAGEFPAPPSETALPGGALNQVIRAFGGQPTDREDDLFERSLFYDAVTRARNRLVLSACRTDDEGETLGLSWFFEEVADRIRPASEGEDVELQRYTRLAERPDPDSADERESYRAAAVAADVCNDHARAALSRTGVQPGMRVVEGALKEPVVSPSQVEAYLRCPYRWFYQYALRPAELERSFDFRDEGEICHRLLAETYRVLIEEDAVPLNPATLEHAQEVLEQVTASELPEPPSDAALAIRVGMSRSRVWAHRILALDAARRTEFRPTLIEWGFGSDDEPVDLDGILLRGRVDRVDTADDGRALVVDYKRSCSSTHAAAKMLEDGRIQLPLYLAALRARTGLEPVAVVYRGLANAEERGAAVRGEVDGLTLKRTDLLDADDFSSLIDGAVDLAREAMEGMRAGYVPTRPRTDSACVGCPVGPVCESRR